LADRFALLLDDQVPGVGILRVISAPAGFELHFQQNLKLLGRTRERRELRLAIHPKQMVEKFAVRVAGGPK